MVKTLRLATFGLGEEKERCTRIQMAWICVSAALGKEQMEGLDIEFL